jgi:hypothetical protein
MTSADVHEQDFMIKSGTPSRDAQQKPPLQATLMAKKTNEVSRVQGQGSVLSDRPGSMSHSLGICDPRFAMRYTPNLSEGRL